ncbi:E3 ubiquitin ligase Rnf157-like isoform X3 [Symsagittifera roscoffensis]|uniref:E3 ubiquitin ligase Rnf157-like isoform X3 n=1 Tax=Symsagittifera roscoffensis TaxID=84072 RepID=UPI00307B9EDE
MGGFFSSPTSDVFDQPDSELFADFFYIGGIKFSTEKIKLDQSQRDGRNDTRNVDAKLDSRLLFGSKEDMMHLGKNKAFPFSGPLPNGNEPLTTLRASVFVQRDSLRINKEVGEGFMGQRNIRGPQQQPLLNQYTFSCRFETDVPGTATLYQKATEVFKDGKLCFHGEKIHEMKFEKPSNGAPVEFVSIRPIDHEGLVREWNLNQGKADGKDKDIPTPLVLHLEADEKHHPGHSHAAYMRVEQNGNQYSAKLEKLHQCNNGVVFLLQEIYNANAETSEPSGGRGQADEDAIAPCESAPRFECQICLDKPMDSVLLPCRHLAFCSGCAVAMKLHKSLCPFCRKPYLVVLQIFFLKRESECSMAEKEAAMNLAQALAEQARNNTWSNQGQPGMVPEGMLRLPIGIVVCPPAKNPLEGAAGMGGSFMTGGGLGTLNGSISRSSIHRHGYDTQLSQQSVASIHIGGGGMSPSDYGTSQFGRSGTLASKFELPNAIYEKDEHRNETIQRNPATITHNSRALPKVPGDEDHETMATGTPTRYQSYEALDSGMKSPGYKINSSASSNAAEVHASNPSLQNTPVSQRKQQKGTPSSKSRGKNKLAELPPPPEHMLTTSGRQDSQEEELEERNRTLVPGKFPGSSGGDASGAHRARFPGTVKRDTHRSDIYESTPSPNSRAASKSPSQQPNFKKQVADHLDRKLPPTIAAEAKLSGGRDSPSARNQPLPQIPQTPSRGKSMDQVEGLPPPLFRSGISLQTLPHGGAKLIKPGHKSSPSQKQHHVQSQDAHSSLQHTLSSGDHSPSTLNREHNELSSLTKTPSNQFKIDSLGRQKTQTASNYVNLGSLNSKDRAPKRPPRGVEMNTANSAAQGGYINTPNPPPVPARGPGMQPAQQKLTSSAGSGLDR